MATAREENRYADGGKGFGKFQKRPLRRTQTTPYDRPPPALRNPNRNNGWFSKILDPAQRLITYSAHKLFSSVFRKRLPPPPPETVHEARDSCQDTTTFVTNESFGKQQGVVGESADQINLSDGVGLPELEKLLKEKTFTRSETDYFLELMRSRSVDTAVGEEGKREEVVPLESMLPRIQTEEYPQTPVLENGIKNHIVSTPHATSSISVEDVASPAQLAQAYMGSRPSNVSPSMLNFRSPSRDDSTLVKGHHFGQKSPTMSIVPRATNHVRVYDNGFLTPRSHGRSTIYNMARTPYPRVYPAFTPQGSGVGVENGPSSSTQHALDRGIHSGIKRGGSKRSYSILDNDIESVGHIRRIRHKSNLLSSKGLSLTHSDSPLSITSSRVGIDAAQQPSSSMQKPILSGEVNHRHTKLSAENVDENMPSSSFPSLPSKSSEMASKILQQLDKMVTPKEKSSVLRLPNVNDKSPTKLSSSMLRGQALRSMDTVDSSKLLDNVQGIELDGTPRSLSASPHKLTSKISKVEHSLKPVSPNDGLIPALTGSDSTVPRNQVISIGKSVDSSDLPSKKRGFCMSAHEVYLELDDDSYPNGVASFSTSGNATEGTTAVAEKTTSDFEKPVQEMPPGPSVVMSSESFTADGNLRTADGIVDAKVDTPTSIASSIPADRTVKPDTSAVQASTHTILGSAQNGSVANPSTELTAGHAQSQESTKAGPIFGLDKVAPSKETSANAPSVNFGFNKNIDNVSQAPFTFSSSVGGESTLLKYSGASESKPSSISSITAAGDVGLVPKVLESEKADAKTNTVSGFSAQSSESSTILSTSPTNIFTFGNSSSQNNGSAASSPAFSSFTPVVTNSFTSQNMFSSSPLATSSSSISAPATSIASTSMTTSTLAASASSNSSSSASGMSSSSPATSLFKFGSTPLPSTSLPVSSSSEPVETKVGQSAGNGNIGNSSAVGSTGNGIFGFSLSAATSINSQSQSQGSVFGTVNGSTVGTLAPSATSGLTTSSQSQSVAFGSSASSLFGFTGNTAFSSGSSSLSSSSPATNIFNSSTTSGQSTPASSSEAKPSATSGLTTSTQSQSVAFGSSASPFGFTGNSAFSSGSSSLPSSSPATNIFNSNTTSGQSTPASSFEVKPVSSNNGTNSTLFGLPSWQPSKSSPFGTSFSSSSSSSTSGFSFGASTPSVASTSSPMIFGSSTVASVPQFSFTSAAATTKTQPAFGNPSPVFAFGSASVNNDQTSMEDSMAEDTVQATPPVTTPVFGQQPASGQSNFIFGAPTPTGASPFQFGGQQNIAPQNPSPFQASGGQQNIAPQNPSPFQASGGQQNIAPQNPFQASGSLEFNAGGSFSLGTGGVDKSGRKHIKIKHNRQRKK